MRKWSKTISTKNSTANFAEIIPYWLFVIKNFGNRMHPLFKVQVSNPEF